MNIDAITSLLDAMIEASAQMLAIEDAPVPGMTFAFRVAAVVCCEFCGTQDEDIIERMIPLIEPRVERYLAKDLT